MVALLREEVLGPLSEGAAAGAEATVDVASPRGGAGAAAEIVSCHRGLGIPPVESEVSGRDASFVRAPECECGSASA